MLDGEPLTLNDHDPRVTDRGSGREESSTTSTARTQRPPHPPCLGTGQGAHHRDGRAATPVVIVPGNTGDGFPFIPLLPHLPGRRIITINRPGGGLSEGIDHSTVDFHDFAVETLTTVFDALGLERAPIIAHSMGGHWGSVVRDRPPRTRHRPRTARRTRERAYHPPPIAAAPDDDTGAREGHRPPRRAQSPDRTALNGLKDPGHFTESIARQPAELAESYYRFPKPPPLPHIHLSLMTSVNRLRGWTAALPDHGRATRHDHPTGALPMGNTRPVRQRRNRAENRSPRAEQRIPHPRSLGAPTLARRPRILPAGSSPTSSTATNLWR